MLRDSIYNCFAGTSLDPTRNGYGSYDAYLDPKNTDPQQVIADEVQRQIEFSRAMENARLPDLSMGCGGKIYGNDQTDMGSIADSLDGNSNGANPNWRMGGR